MAQFNPEDYETVDSRIKRFYNDHTEGRITTELVAMDGDVGATRWVVKASIWRGCDCDSCDCDATAPADGTGYAFEVDGTGMANRTSALENCETSAIGRALANIGYSGDKRASREEMQKAQAQPAVDESLVLDWVAAMEAATDLSGLQSAWAGAGKAGVTRDPRVVDAKDKRKRELSDANTG